MQDFQRLGLAFVSDAEVRPDDNWIILTETFPATSADNVAMLGRLAGAAITKTYMPDSEDGLSDAIQRFADAAQPPIADPNFAIAARGYIASQGTTQERESQLAARSLEGSLGGGYQS